MRARDRLLLVLRQPVGAISLVFIVGLVLVAIFGPSFLSDPTRISRDVFVPPSPDFPLGTDHLGRDQLSRLVIGARVSLVVGFLAAGASVLIGITVGALAGFLSRKVDITLMRVSELFQVMPTLIVAIAFVALLGASLTNIIIVIAILSWAQTARVMRAEVLRVRQLDFVNAARCLGMRESRVLLREVVPNAIPAVLPLIALGVAEAILQESSISFLGLGSPDTISWGLLIHDGQRQILRAWWMIVFPGLAVFFTVLAFNLVGDAVATAMSPRARQSGSRVLHHADSQGLDDPLPVIVADP